MSAPDHLAERYGTPRRGRRTALVAAVGVVAVAFGGWLAWTSLVHASPAISSQLVSFDVVDDQTVTVVVQLDLDDDLVEGLRSGTRTATCTLRAGAEDHRVVGELSFTPAPASGRIEQTIRTERRATSAESLGCTTEGQPRPR